MALIGAQMSARSVERSVKEAALVRVCAGESLRSIAASIGCSYEAVRQWTEGRGLGDRKQLKKLTPAQVLEIRDRYTHGEVSRTIAYAMGITPATVIAHLLPGQVRRRGRQNTDRARLLALLRRNTPVREIACKLGCTTQNVYFWIKKLKEEAHVKTEETDRNGADRSQATGAHQQRAAHPGTEDRTSGGAGA